MGISLLGQFLSLPTTISDWGVTAVWSSHLGESHQSSTRKKPSWWWLLRLLGWLLCCLVSWLFLFCLLVCLVLLICLTYPKMKEIVTHFNVCNILCLYNNTKTDTMIKLNIYLFKILRNVWQISCMYLNITFWINVFLQYETAKQSCKHCCRPETAFSLLQCLTDGKFAEMTHRAPGRCWRYSLFFQISENRKLWKVSLCNISHICTWSISVLYLALPESTF